jgi:hypothetical protein
MTSGKERRPAARARIRKQLETQTMDRLAGAAGRVGAELIAHKSDLLAAAFIASSARAITNAGVLNIVPSLASNGATQVFYVAPSCIRCSARPAVSSVGSRAAYCFEHWKRLWSGA